MFVNDRAKTYFDKTNQYGGSGKPKKPLKKSSKKTITIPANPALHKVGYITPKELQKIGSLTGNIIKKAVLIRQRFPGAFIKLDDTGTFWEISSNDNDHIAELIKNAETEAINEMKNDKYDKTNQLKKISPKLLTAKYSLDYIPESYIPIKTNKPIEYSILNPQIMKIMLLNTNNIAEFNDLTKFCSLDLTLRSICFDPDVFNHYFYLSNSGFNWNNFNNLFQIIAKYQKSKDPKLSKALIELKSTVDDFYEINYHQSQTITKYINEINKWVKYNYYINKGEYEKIIKFIFGFLLKIKE